MNYHALGFVNLCIRLFIRYFKICKRMREEELPYLLVLKKLPNIGDIRARELLHKFGSAKEVFYALNANKHSQFGSILSKLTSKSLQVWLEEAKFEIDNFLKLGIKFIHIGEAAYPKRLKQCIDAPILLFYRGNITWNSRKSISIVGTRSATSYGLSFCKELISELQLLDVQIISGLAYGIDIKAHLSAMENGLETVACLAHGLHTVYPSSHAKYAKEIQLNGGLVSEFPTYSTMEKSNFIKRNRIIAGLSHATVVIESAKRGGSLLTAELANSYNREVFALPGRVGDIKSEGCNNLIKTNQARLIQSVADLVYILNWDLEELIEHKPIQTSLFIELTDEEEALYNIIKEKGKESLDLLAIEAAMSPQRAVVVLLGLELKGIIRPLPGKQFELVR